MAISNRFLQTTYLSFTKLRFRRSFWGAEQVQNLFNSLSAVFFTDVRNFKIPTYISNIFSMIRDGKFPMQTFLQNVVTELWFVCNHFNPGFCTYINHSTCRLFVFRRHDLTKKKLFDESEIGIYRNIWIRLSRNLSHRKFSHQNKTVLKSLRILWDK